MLGNAFAAPWPSPASRQRLAPVSRLSAWPGTGM